ncbi:hypothetical protein OG225_42025 (plasmid) [Nocardia sp. NBC_01377]|uniref:hypothetical protein n=1 Tax=Nocardia sp. NBC_01377 TaxID=2903595 RepID=UPI00324F57E6
MALVQPFEDFDGVGDEFDDHPGFFAYRAVWDLVSVLGAFEVEPFHQPQPCGGVEADAATPQVEDLSDPGAGEIGHDHETGGLQEPGQQRHLIDGDPGMPQVPVQVSGDGSVEIDVFIDGQPGVGDHAARGSGLERVRAAQLGGDVAPGRFQGSVGAAFAG